MIPLPTGGEQGLLADPSPQLPRPCSPHEFADMLRGSD
jgi:hypothetical protein